MKALSGIDFVAEEGEKVFIAGKTGSGKSTLLRIFNGLIPFFYGGKLKGEVNIFGKSSEDVKKDVFFISQFPDEQILMGRVRDEIVFPLLQRGLDFEEAEKKALKVAKKLGVEDLMEKRTDEISEGQKQMVMLATALASGSRAIVLDEPFAHLHVRRAKTLHELLLKSENTIIASDHRIELSRGFRKVSMTELNREVNQEADQYGEDESEQETEFQVKRKVSKVVEVENLHFSYSHSDQLFSGLSFEVREGMTLAITGDNGVGKTTLLKILAGLLKPDKGRVMVHGKPSLSMQFPNYHFFSRSVADELGNITIFGLEKLAGRHPHSLSAGEAKRVSIAKAFRSDIVLLDEPMCGQDTSFRVQLLNEARRRGRTLILATHDEKLAAMCDEVINLDEICKNCKKGS